MLHFFAEFLGRIALAFLWWLLLFPIVWFLSLLFTLCIALFRKEPYSFAVFQMWLSVYEAWKEWGLVLIP